MKGERKMRVSKKSKILALALSLTMLMCVMPMLAMAEVSSAPIAIAEDGVSVEDIGDGLLEVTITYDVTEEAGDQITLLATVTQDEITEGNANEVIAYIDQFARAEATGTFKFKMDSTKLDGTSVYVKIGGSNVETPAEAIGTFTETSEGVKVFGYVTVAGATVKLDDDTTTTTDADGRFEFVNVTAGDYTITIDKRGAIARTVEVTVAGEDVAVSEEDEIELIMGNFYTDDEDDGIGRINVSDLTLLLNYFNKTSQDDDFDEMFNLYTDDENDGIAKINVSDLTLFLNNFNRTSEDYK